MPERIDRSEWLAELSRLTAKSDDGLTARELAEAWGVSLRTTLERLRLAHRRGWVTVGRRTVGSMDGKQQPVPVYVVKAPRGGK